MALETLKYLDTIGGVKVKEVEWGQPEGNYIEVNHKHNAITFKIQDGPIKEKGVNGCQVDHLIMTSIAMIEGLDIKYPCRENAEALTKLEEALMWLDNRKKDREQRGVEGYNKA